MNYDVFIVISKWVGFLTFILTVLYTGIKYFVKTRIQQKTEVNKFLLELDKTIVTFKIKSYSWEQPLSRLFEGCSVKSLENRINSTGIFPWESHFINHAVKINNNIPMDVFYGAVSISINNASELHDFIKKGSLPKTIKLINLEPLLNSHHIYIDCKKESLNDYILKYKKTFLSYDKKLVRQFKWLQWQPYI